MLVVADDTRRPSVFVGSQQFGATTSYERHRKKETSRPRSTLRYRIRSIARGRSYKFSSASEGERKREGSYRSSDFTIDIVTATGYRVDWDVPGSCSESSRDEIHERILSDTVPIYRVRFLRRGISLDSFHDLLVSFISLCARNSYPYQRQKSFALTPLYTYRHRDVHVACFAFNFPFIKYKRWYR